LKFRPQITYELDVYNNMFWARNRCVSQLRMFALNHVPLLWPQKEVLDPNVKRSR